jgi:hypothetical protein
MKRSFFVALAVLSFIAMPSEGIASHADDAEAPRAVGAGKGAVERVADLERRLGITPDPDSGLIARVTVIEKRAEKLWSKKGVLARVAHIERGRGVTPDLSRGIIDRVNAIELEAGYEVDHSHGVVGRVAALEKWYAEKVAEHGLLGRLAELEKKFPARVTSER